MLPKFLISYLAFVLIIPYSFSQVKNYKSEFGFKSDNDSYLLRKKDRYYTNGIFITFRQAIKQGNSNNRVVKKIWEAEAGQYLYTPFTGRISRITSIDRPFAAYLYAGGKLNWFFKNEQILQGTLQIGIIGPAAKGRETQISIHHALGIYEPRGWQYQIKNETGINASAEYTRLLKRLFNQKTDISLNSYLKVGNTFSGAGIGALFRIGKINPLFQSITTNSRISNNSKSDSIPKKELFFYTKPILQYIAYDASIQGGLFREDKGLVTFEPKPLVFSQELGLMYAHKRWNINFAVFFKSKEIQSRAKAHQYGSVSVGYRFN